MSPRTLGRVLPLGIAALLFFAVGAWTLAGAVNVPFADEWRFVPWVLDFEKGELELADLWAPHNEHRLVLPQILLLALSGPTGFDLRVGVLLSWMLVGAALVLVHRLALSTAVGNGGLAAGCVVLLGAGLLLSPAAWEVWTWGWAVQIPMVLVAALVCALGLARWRGGSGQTALLAAAGLAGAFSFAAGLALLPLCALTLLAGDRGVPRARRWRHAAALGSLGILVLGVYLVGLPMGGGRGIGVGRAIDLPLFAAAFVGAPLADGSLPFASALGGTAVALLLALGIALLRGSARDRALPWLFLAAFALGTAAAASVGRTARGWEAALASRYLTLSALVWMALLALLLVWAKESQARTIRRAGLAVFGLLLLVGLPAWWSGWRSGVATVHTHNDAMWNARAALLRGPPYPIGSLEPLWPETVEVVAAARGVGGSGGLSEAQLGPFAPGGGRVPHGRSRKEGAPLGAPRGEVVRIDSRGEQADGPWHLEVALRMDGRLSYSRRSLSGNRHLRLAVEPKEARRFYRELVEAGALDLETQVDRGVAPWTWVRLLDPERPGGHHTFGYSAVEGVHGDVQRRLVAFLVEHVPGDG